MQLRHIAMTAAAATVLVAGSAQALESRSISYTLNPGGPGTVYGDMTGRYTASAGGGFASVDSGGVPLTYALVHAHTDENTSNPNGYSEPGASADIEYGFSGQLICSGTGGCATVGSAPTSPLTVSGYVGLQVNSLGSFASTQIGDAYGVSFYCYEGGTDCGTHQFSYAPTLTGMVTAGIGGAYTIDYVGHLSLYVTALANTIGYGDPSSDAFGYVDPMIAFDPSVLAAGFTAGPIVLSDGIANASAPPPAFGGTVPEPASWALLIAGFGLTGSAMRRRTATRAA